MVDSGLQIATQVVDTCAIFLPFLLDKSQVASAQFAYIMVVPSHARRWSLAQQLWQCCMQHWQQDMEFTKVADLVALKPDDKGYQALLIRALAERLRQTPASAQELFSLLGTSTTLHLENRVEAEKHAQIEDIVQHITSREQTKGNSSNVVTAREHATIRNVELYIGPEDPKTTKQQDRQTSPVKVVILTSQGIVYRTVQSQLSGLRQEVPRTGTIYERGQWKPSGRIIDVAMAEIESDRTNAALEAERAISHFQPAWVMFIGLAGGMKDVHVGDVVVATKIYDYASSTADTSLRIRPELARSSYALIQRARAEARKTDWLPARLEGQPLLPKVLIGPIAAGEVIVASRTSPLYTFLQQHYSDALAIELEGYGFLHAAHANQHVNALVLRGISHIIGEQESASAETQAAQHVSAFMYALLTGGNLST